MDFPEYVVKNTSELVPYARNSRLHSSEQITQIADSIKEFGFLNPVIVDGENGIIAGHGRVMAAQELGIEQLPCIEAAHLTEAQRRAYVIADNKLAMNSTWDESLLKIELKELETIGYDIEGLGFDHMELDSILDVGISIDVDGAEGKTGSNLPKMKFGKAQVEMNADELEALMDLYNQHIDATGSSFGFVTRLING